MFSRLALQVVQPLMIVREALFRNYNFFYSEFICQMDVGIPCPAGVDKDLWKRFEAFEKWNAAH